MPDENAAQHEFFFADETTRKDLILGPGSAPKLRPAQVTFNKNIKRLRQLQARMEDTKAAIEHKKIQFAGEVLPVLGEFNRTQIQWLHIMLDCHQDPRVGLGKVQSAKLMDIILDDFDSLGRNIHGVEPEEMDKLKDRIDDILGPDEEDDYEDEDDAELKSAVMEMMGDFMGMQGLDVDFTGVDPEDFDGMEARVEDAMNRAGHPPPKPRKPSSKKAAAADERLRKQREKEQAKLRDFKSLFKSLAKAMHPDLVTDPVDKEHREDWMKRLTSAYESQDLHGMLTIEMEWLGSESQDLAKASDQKLAIYSELLREQILEAEEQVRLLMREDPFMAFQVDHSHGPPSAANLCPLITADTDRLTRQIQKITKQGKGIKKFLGDLIRSRQQSYYYF